MELRARFLARRRVTFADEAIRGVKLRCRLTDAYGVPFDVYVAGDPSAQRYICDIWWYIHFLNRWGEVATHLGDRVLTLRYEDVLASPGAGIRSVARHFGIRLSESSIRLAVEGSSKSAMLAHEDPDASERVISVRAEDDPVFGPREKATFDRIVAANLRYDFGYRHASRIDPTCEEAPKNRAFLGEFGRGAPVRGDIVDNN